MKGDNRQKKGSQGGSILRIERIRRAYCTHKWSDGKERERRETGTATGTMVVWTGKGYVIFPRGSPLFFCNITNPQQSKQNKQTRKTKAKGKEKKYVRVPQRFAKEVKQEQEESSLPTVLTDLFFNVALCH
jgi:hypothetical protein